ncbi:MAG: polysaccharide biosynthesis protein, partial [Clostridia bacterium]
ISTAGLPTAISRMVAERVTLGDYLGARRVFRKAQFLLLVFGVATAALMFFGADALAMSTVGPGAAPSFRAMAPSLLIVALLCSYRGYLQGMQRMTGTALTQIVEQVGKLVIGLYLAYLWMPRGLEYGALGAVVGVTLSELLALLVIAVIYVRRRHEFLPAQAPSIGINDHNVFRDLMLIAVPVTIGGSIMSLTGIVDASLIKRTLLEIGFTDIEASMRYVCLRSNVTTIINMPAVLTVALAMSLVPAISAARTHGDIVGVHNISNLGIKIATLIGMPCTIGLLVLAGPALDLLYDIDPVRLSIATSLMRTSALCVIFLSLVQGLTGILQGIGKQNVPVINLAIGGVVKIVIMLTLMRNPNIEIQGAAISNVACYAVAGLLNFIYLIRYTQLKVNWMDAMVKPFLAALVMGASAFFSYVFIQNRIPSNTIATMGAILIGAVLYFAVVLLSHMFTQEDLNLIPGGKYLARFSR